MDRGPVALFGAIVAVGLGPALWLGAQFGRFDVTPPSPPVPVDRTHDTTTQLMGGTAGGEDATGDDDTPVGVTTRTHVRPVRTRPTPEPSKSSAKATPSASPSASHSPSPSVSPTDPSDPPSTENGGGGDSTPPSPPPSEGSGGGGDGGGSGGSGGSGGGGGGGGGAPADSHAGIQIES